MPDDKTINKENASLIENLKAKLSGLSNVIEISDDRMDALNKTFKGVGDSAIKFAGNIENVVKISLKSFGDLAVISGSKFAKEFVNPLNESKIDLNPIAKVLGPILTGMLAGGNEAMKNFISTQQIMRNAIVISGQDISNASSLIRDYPQAVRQASAETGFSIDNINIFNKTVGRFMPEALNLAIKSHMGIKDSTGGMIQPTIVAMTAFRAFGIEGQEAANKMAKAFLEFGQGPITTAKNLGIMSRAAKDAGVDFQTAEDQIVKASSYLAIFGAQTGEASAVWRTFNQVLRDGGVPITEIGNLVTSVTQNMAKMSTENRAFIGMMSGMTRGSSALGGALKMELMMREPGGMQKNLEALTGTLSKFAGGRIVTLQEAANNPQLEMQFQVQRQMLEKLGVSGDESQRARILEVMQKIQSGGISAIDADKAVGEIYGKGKDLQQQSLTQLEKIYQVLRGAFGKEADVKMDDMNKSLRKPLDLLTGVVVKQRYLQDNVINNKDTFGALTAFTSDAKEMVSRMTKTGTERIGPRGMDPIHKGAADEVASAIQRGMHRGRSPEGDAVSATRPPEKPFLRIDPQMHTELGHLITATKQISTTLNNKLPDKGTTKSSESGASTLIVKFIGSEKEIIDKVTKQILKTVQDHTLGIAH